jgi:hypothetical protein
MKVTARPVTGMTALAVPRLIDIPDDVSCVYAINVPTGGAGAGILSTSVARFLMSCWTFGGSVSSGYLRAYFVVVPIISPQRDYGGSICGR